MRRKRSQNGDLIPTERLPHAVIKEMDSIHHPSRAETRAAINCMCMNVLGSPPPSSWQSKKDGTGVGTIVSIVKMFGIVTSGGYERVRRVLRDIWANIQAKKN